MNATIEKLCWPILTIATDRANSNLIDLDFELDLLCAATYVNVISVVKRLVQKGYRPQRKQAFFDPPMTLAALTGNKHLQEYLQKMVIETRSSHNLKAEHSSSIIGAAMSGDRDVVKTALYPPSWSTINDTNFIEGPIVDRQTSAWRSLWKAQRYTGNLEMYKYLQGFFQRPQERPDQSVLMLHIRFGNFEIVKHILNTTVTFFSGARGDYGAKRQDMIDLIFEYGFDTNFLRLDRRQSKWLGDEMASMEAQTRNTLLVHKLFDLGASIYDVRTAITALEWAVSREDTVMVGGVLQALDTPKGALDDDIR
ncbi:hypothetical protein BOTNAR_0010g00040 [Botryotinia narcissicola]|uniref:Uncharacterized protein n=1 Tax=Botryotinia narcissicola TaxID=278944 RepID=A0A4Z1JD85_9HELO|nr:hypothetical protein BOTNAR_0010g00040 [Botryotinia narcissicola]